MGPKMAVVPKADARCYPEIPLYHATAMKHYDKVTVNQRKGEEKQKEICNNRPVVTKKGCRETSLV